MAKQVYIFDARLVGVRGVRRKVAVSSDQTLVDLHDVLQSAFGWDDDHLYSFWLSGEFWARDGTEYTRPFELEPEQRSACTRLDRLDLDKGHEIAYLFDFGDEWRVRLTLRDIRSHDRNQYPRVLESVGEAPPQYPEYDEVA